MVRPTAGLVIRLGAFTRGSYLLYALSWHRGTAIFLNEAESRLFTALAPPCGGRNVVVAALTPSWLWGPP